VARRADRPCGFVLSRQKLKTLKPERDFGDPQKGGYIIKRREGAKITLAASGSEVMLALKAGCALEEQGIAANVVSMPCMELFLEQSDEYRREVFDPKTKVLAIEAASALEWHRFADDVISMEGRFGASGPADVLFEAFGFSVKNIVERAKALLG